MKDFDAIYFTARGLPPEDQAAYVAEACGGDATLRRRLEEMLALADEAEAFVTDLPDDEPPREGSRRQHARRSRSRSEEGGVLEDMIGQKIGRYRILEWIGEGGCGAVYVAEQTEPVRRRVALKFIKPGMDTREVIARFEAERQALAMMDHPNIAKVFDAGTTETGRPYFIMELVRGIKITDCCDQSTLTTNERLDLFIKVCQAIQHAHQKGIIHRDIKPSNILVTMHDGVPVPKVIDFGIAKATAGRLTDSTIYTQFHHFIGTPAYMSPEQAGLSGLDIDTRSDIYSLGVLLYELLTGSTPFDAKELISEGVDAMRRTIREREPVRPSTKLSQTLSTTEDNSHPSTTDLTIPTRAEARDVARRRQRLKEQIARVKGDLDWVVMKCLEKDRSRRYDTANGLVQDLLRHLNNEPVLASPPSRLYALQKFATRNKWPVTLAVTVVVLILAGLVGTSIGLRRATVARIQSDESARRANRSADEARQAEAAAQHQAYSVTMLSASDALTRGLIATARLCLDRAPERLRGWEWAHLSSRLDLSVNTHLHPRSRTGTVLVSPDRRSYYDICGDPGRGIRRRDFVTGQLLSTLSTNHAYWHAGFMDENRKLVVQIHDNHNSKPGGIEVWDLERETLLSYFPLEDLSLPATLHDSWVAYRLKDQLWLMDVTTGAKTLASPAMAGTEMAFQPGRSRLAFCPTKEEIALLDLKSLQIVARFKGHRNQISAMAFSPDGRWLATGALDGTIRITNVDATPPDTVGLLNGHTDWILGLCFSPDGSRLASSSRDRTLRLWDPRTGRCENVLANGDQVPSFHPDGRILIGPAETGLRFWDMQVLEASVLRGHQSYVYPVLLSPDGATVYTGGWDGYYGQPGSLRFWDAATGEPFAEMVGTNEFIRAAALSPDGSRLAIALNGRSSQRINVLDTTTAMTIASVTNVNGGPGGPAIESLIFDPGGDNLLWVDARHVTVNVADARTGQILKTKGFARDPGGRQYSRIARSPDGRTIAAYIAGNSNVFLLDGRSLEPVRHWPHRQRQWLFSMSFSPDGTRLLTTSGDGLVRVWDVATGASLHDLAGHGSRVHCAVYSPDGKRIASGGSDYNVRLWDAETFEPVANLSGHQDYVHSLVWRADSQQIVSSSGDNTVRLWDTQPLTGRLQARRERQAILPKVERSVQRLWDELGDARKVVERIQADRSLSPRERQVAQQVALRKSVEQQKAATSSLDQRGSLRTETPEPTSQMRKGSIAPSP